MTRAQDTRERILFGAEEVVLRDGVAHLTLEAAASEAGISKGGILYHFPTRAALVAAMVERLSAAIQRGSRAAQRRVGSARSLHDGLPRGDLRAFGGRRGKP